MNKLKLEHPTVEDSEEIFELINRNRKRFEKWFDWIFEMSSIQNEAKYIDEANNTDAQELYCIKYDNEIIGMIDLHEIDLNDKSAEVGYWIDEYFEGFGIISNIIVNLEDFIQEALDIERLKIVVSQNNIRSINVAQRADFEFTRREAGNITYQKALN